MKNIRRATRKQYSAEEKIRVVLDGLRCESTFAELCRRERIAEGHWQLVEEFLSGSGSGCGGRHQPRAASGEVTDVRHEARALKQVVAEQALELRLLKKGIIADGGDGE